MQAEESLKKGDLQESLTQLENQVRKDPSNAKNRIFLFQLLSVLGDWDRAMIQLNVAVDLDAGTLAMVQTYREALRCEVLRKKIFNGQKTPLVFGDPEQWVALLLEALHLSAEGKYAQSQQLRDRAFEAAPATAGKIDDKEFQWIADADIRMGPILELIFNGRYYWVPFHRITCIQIEEPVDLRDLVWMPSHITWANGGETVGLIPTRYPETENCGDPMLNLGRKTEWVDQGEGLHFGFGQRLLATDNGEFSLMDIRRIDLDTKEETDDAVQTGG